MYVDDELDRLAAEYDQCLSTAAQGISTALHELDSAGVAQRLFMKRANRHLVALQKERDTLILDGMQQAETIRLQQDRINNLGIKLANRNARIAELEQFAGLNQPEYVYPSVDPDPVLGRRREVLHLDQVINVESPAPELPEFPDSPAPIAEVAKVATSTRQKKAAGGRKKKKNQQPRKQGRGYRIPLEKALEMRQLFDTGGESIADIARAYEVSYSVAHRVCKGVTYKDQGHD